jgi:hypothetical protein
MPHLRFRGKLAERRLAFLAWADRGRQRGFSKEAVAGVRHDLRGVVGAVEEDAHLGYRSGNNRGNAPWAWRNDEEA